MRVLLVEDSGILLRTVRRALHYGEFAVDAAMDGKEGLAAAETNDYDVLVLDIMLPELDGLALWRRLRPLVETRNSYCAFIICSLAVFIPSGFAG